MIMEYALLQGCPHAFRKKKKVTLLKLPIFL